jgi:hypothetical protein
MADCAHIQTPRLVSRCKFTALPRPVSVSVDIAQVVQWIKKVIKKARLCFLGVQLHVREVHYAASDGDVQSHDGALAGSSLHFAPATYMYF